MKSILSAIFLILIFSQISVAQWTMDTAGIGRMTERSIAVSGNNIFTGTFDAGVYLSTDNGSSWSQTSLNSHFIYSLAVNGSNVYAGTYTDGLYISTNNGSTWTLSTLVIPYIVSLAASGNNIFAGVYYDGLYMSANNGLTWTHSALNTGDVYSIAISGATVYAGTYQHGVYISTDNGSTWNQSSLNNQIIQTLFINGNNIFAGTYSSAGIYLSTDNGTSWNHQTSLLNRSIYSFAMSGSNIFAGSDGYGVYVSSDNGTNWTQRNEGLVGMERVYGLCILNNYIFAATDYSEYRRGINDFIGIKQISQLVPGHFTLSQNYPNPFNPSTKIRFDIPKQGLTKITVFDILGREVTTLANEVLNAGKYEVDFNASAYSSGLYFYRITSGDYTEVKKMILVK